MASTSLTATFLNRPSANRRRASTVRDTSKERGFFSWGSTSPPRQMGPEEMVAKNPVNTAKCNRFVSAGMSPRDTSTR